MDINNVKTMTGLTMAEAAAKLDEQLPAEAYTAVPGGADLTDIDPNYMRKVLNEVFGLCGLGWGYEYDPADMEIRSETRQGNGNARNVIVAALKHLRFWYKVTDGKEASVCTVDASGGSDNSSRLLRHEGRHHQRPGQRSLEHRLPGERLPGPPVPQDREGSKARSCAEDRCRPKAAAPAPAAAQSAPAARQPAPAKAKTTSAPAPAPAASADDEIEEIEPPSEPDRG